MIKKKKIIERIQKRPEPLELPMPAILAPTGHDEDPRTIVMYVLQAYNAVK